MNVRDIVTWDEWGSQGSILVGSMVMEELELRRGIFSEIILALGDIPDLQIYFGYPDPAAVGQRCSRQAYQSPDPAALHADSPLSKVQWVFLMFSNELQCYFSFSTFFHVLSLTLQIALPPLVPRARAGKPTSKLCSLNIGSESRNSGDAECRLRLIYHIKTGFIGG